MKWLKRIPLFITALFVITIGRAQQSTLALEFDNGRIVNETLKKYTKALENAYMEGKNDFISKDVMANNLNGGFEYLKALSRKIYRTNSFTNTKPSLSNNIFSRENVENNRNYGEWSIIWGRNLIINNKTNKVLPIPYHNTTTVIKAKIGTMHSYLDYLDDIIIQGYPLAPPIK